MQYASCIWDVNWSIAIWKDNLSMVLGPLNRAGIVATMHIHFFSKRSSFFAIACVRVFIYSTGRMNCHDSGMAFAVCCRFPSFSFVFLCFCGVCFVEFVQTCVPGGFCHFVDVVGFATTLEIEMQLPTETVECAHQGGRITMSPVRWMNSRGRFSGSRFGYTSRSHSKIGVV